ncbi:hypothetical protein [Candidatus Villigracilis affinis]|uniref:hypothetical protein n=1 Tax=Candidatus Villigracilis affinis TaxID=3140682 RepID=UPI001D3AF0EF|nr:hypothetical protein [Anaerolineales bacterium]
MSGNTSNKSDTPILVFGLVFFLSNFLFNKKSTNSNSFFSTDLVNVGFSIIIGVYTYYFVKYMWKIRDVAPTQQFRTVVKRFVGAPILVLITDLAIFFIGYIFNIDKIWTGMGIWATLSWVLLLGVVVLSDRRGW